MRFTKDTLQNVKLAMWEKTELPDNELKDGKWVKTGRVTEKTTYTFRDATGEKLVILGSNDYRNFEGELVDVTFELKFDEFKKRLSVKLGSVQKADPALL